MPTIPLTAEERDYILKECLILPDESERQLKEAVGDPSGCSLDIDAGELDDLLGFIAAEANHAENRKKEDALEVIYDKLMEYESP